MTERLIEILGKEAALFETFLELLGRQQEMLIANDADGLRLVSETIREKVIENRLLNQQREDAVNEIKRRNAIEGDLNVSRLLEMVDEQQADQLQHLRNTIFALTDRITETRNRNALLINRSREYIARTMEMLSHISGPSGIYAANGNETDRRQAVAIDRSA